MVMTAPPGAETVSISLQPGRFRGQQQAAQAALFSPDF